MSPEEIANRFRRFIDEFSILNDRGEQEFVYREAIRDIIDGRKRSLRMKISDLMLFDENLARIVIDNPRDTIPLLNKILAEIVSTKTRSYGGSVYVRVYGLGETLRISEVSNTKKGKLIEVEGIVSSISQPISYIKEAIFQCEVCGRTFPIEEDIEFRTPAVCPYPDCTNTNPRKIRFVDAEGVDEYQIIELVEHEHPITESSPSMKVMVKGDIVGKFRPGQKVIVTGYIKVRSEKGKVGMYFEGLDVRDKETEFILAPGEIRKIRNTRNLEELVIESIAPLIYGLDPIKKAIAAQLFGGVPKILPDGARIRGELRILIVGDTATGKTLLLKRISKIAPKAVYTDGKGFKGKGLIFKIRGDPPTICPGPLVLGDRGLVIIDDMQKISAEDKETLPKVLDDEKLEVQAGKTKIILDARAAILAATTPKGGKYQHHKSLKDNIRLPPEIISRFDLIFVIGNKSKEKAEFLLSINRYGVPPARLSDEEIRKLIVYAREYVTPKLSPEAEKIIKEYFSHLVEMAERLRENFEEPPIEITNRHLETLRILAEAHARMLLKEKADEGDARFAIEIMNESLRSLGFSMDEIMLYSISIGKRSKYWEVIEVIERLQRQYPECVPLEEIIKICEKKGISEDFVRKVIAKEKMNGNIYEKKPNCILFV